MSKVGVVLLTLACATATDFIVSWPNTMLSHRELVVTSSEQSLLNAYQIRRSCVRLIRLLNRGWLDRLLIQIGRLCARHLRLGRVEALQARAAGLLQAQQLSSLDAMMRPFSKCARKLTPSFQATAFGKLGLPICMREVHVVEARIKLSGNMRASHVRAGTHQQCLTLDGPSMKARGRTHGSDVAVSARLTHGFCL